MTFKLKREKADKPKKHRTRLSFDPANAPTSLSFSGALTSGFMLRRWIDKHGRYPDYVLFCNTGKERDETLDFVRDVQENWNVNVIWLEYTRGGDNADSSGHGFKVVSYETAHRNGQPNGPFDKLLEWMNVLPNIQSRSCSVQMKLRTMKRYLASCGVPQWTECIGIRADESHRKYEILAHVPSYVHTTFPLIDAGVTLADVQSFWFTNPFTLNLKPHEGNCDLCWAKAKWKIVQQMKERPGCEEWWIEQERAFKTRGNVATGAQFREDRSYAGMKFEADNQLEILPADDESACGCMDGAFRWEDSE